VKAVRTVIELSMVAKIGRPRKKWLNMVECDIVCA